jgi:protein ImuB
VPRHPSQEATCLQQLALAALTFTPSVAIHVDAIVLDIAASLRLFGGMHRLVTRLKASFADTGLVVTAGVAPTPLAAWLIARARTRGIPTRHVRDMDALATTLAPLPLNLFDWPYDRLQALATLGIHTIAALQQLPRAGLKRRFGEQVLIDLDCAHARRPDPRPYYQAPEHYVATIEFMDAIHDLHHLLHIADRLWAGLANFLRARALATPRHALVFEHGQRDGSTSVTVATHRPGIDPARWRLVAREHLQRLPLPAPVYALRIEQVVVQPYAPHEGQLFPGDENHAALQLDDLMEILAARLGSERVVRVRAIGDHRPERATRETTLAPLTQGARHGPPLTWSGLRPYGLLPQARSLVERDGAPLWHGELAFLAGPERIETGWWDGAPARRDYFIVRNRHGECAWVYRDLSRGGWYLHGLFV